MSISEGIELNVEKAIWVSEYTVQVLFSDGAQKELDFRGFLTQSDQPEIRKYLDVEQFKAFEICYGNLVWNDYDLCFSIEDLYSGHLIVQEAVSSKVAEDSPDYQVGD